MNKLEFVVLLGLIWFCSPVNAKSMEHDTLNRAYYFYINQAEISVVNSSHKQADSLYSIAFRYAKRSFGQDYFQAALNATALNSDSLIFYYLKESILHGVEFSQIKKDKTFKAYFQTKGIKLSKELVGNYHKLRKEYIKTLDLKTSRKISRLVFYDQLVRSIPGFFTLFSAARDRKNFKEIYKICVVTGTIPGFGQIGEHIRSKNDLNDISLLLRHFTNYELKVLEPYLIKSIDQGGIYPWHFASAVDYVSFKSMEVIDRQKDTVTFQFQFIYGSLSPYFLGEKYANGFTDEVNKERSRIGLEPIEDQVYKTGKTMNEYFDLPPKKVISAHRKSLSRVWKKGKPWKK